MQNRILIGVVNVLSVPVAGLCAYLLFIGGLFMTDSGTSTALTFAYGAMTLSAAYAIGTLYAIVQSQRRRSLGWAFVPFIIPLLLLGWILSPGFSFS